VTLTRADLAGIDAIAPQDVAAGTRYPEEFMNRVNLWTLALSGRIAG
jgi:hypothetical protein